MKISEEVKRAYRSAQDVGPAVHRRILADALRDAVAEIFGLQHQVTCATCQKYTHHNCSEYRNTDWQAAAHKKLMGEE